MAVQLRTTCPAWLSSDIPGTTRTVKPKIKRFAWLALAAVFATGAVLAAGWLRSSPSGHFHSYSIFHHDTCDVLTFSNGTVTLQTCCGDEAWGSYERAADGHWVWTFRHGGKKPTTNYFVVQPGAFAITCTDTQSPSSSFTLRRRLSTKIPY